MKNKFAVFPVVSTANIHLFCEILLESLYKGCGAICTIFSITKITHELLSDYLKLGFFELWVEDKSFKVKYINLDVEIPSVNKNCKEYEIVNEKEFITHFYKKFYIDPPDLDLFKKKQTTIQKAKYIEILNNNLLKSNREINRLIETKTNILDFLAHEVRNPLNTFIGYCEILKEQPEAIPVEEISNIFYKHSMSIKRLVDEILDFSKIEKRKLSVEKKKIKLLTFFEDYAHCSSLLVEKKGLSWETKVDPELREKHYIICDEFRLKQVLDNFLSNALKFTESGFIKFSLKKDDQKVNLSIEDSGIGFSPEFKERIFSKFEQEDCLVAGKYGGSGLGLHLAKRLAEMMGASICANSVLGEGAEFEVIFPLFDYSTDDNLLPLH